MAKIISLPDDSIEELSEALSKLAPSVDIKGIASEVSGNVRSVSREDVSRIVRTIVSLYVARSHPESSTASVDDFVEGIWEALGRSERKELQVPPGEKEHIKARLKRLLDFDALNVASKAMNLRHEHERVFCTGRILTDARPVYGSDPKAPPKAAVITHTLKIAYHEGSDEVKEIYVVMGASDIKELRALLDRAESKSTSLRALFDSTNVPVFG
jgi:hypothetical protein